MKLSLNEMKDVLRSHVVKCTFEKADGTERTMQCTLMSTYLPEIGSSEARRKTKKSDDALSVWDVEKNAWRAFRVDRIRSFDPVSA